MYIGRGETMCARRWSRSFVALGFSSSWISFGLAGAFANSVWRSGLRVQGSGFRVQGLGF